MFVALRTTDRSRVTSIAAQWDHRLGELRELAAGGQLICPGCTQPLWLRTGVKRRRHFAHRQLANCSLAHQSPELLEVKAQLYQWLESKYPGHVHLDLPLGKSRRHVDLLVEPKPGRKFAYWVFDRQQRERAEILACQSLPGVHAHFIHTQSTLVEHSPQDIALTASQRDFLGSSDFDTSAGYGGHLHFLNGEDSRLRVYRGLWCVHAPNLYRWEVRREEVLTAARISPKTGEIVFPQDVADRDEWLQERQRLKRARAAAPVAPASRRELAGLPGAEAAEEPVPADLPAAVEEPAPPSMNLRGPFRCEDCGAETLDWSSASPAAGTCVCRNCTTKRHRQKRGDLAGGD